MIRVLGADRITKTIDFMLIDPDSDDDDEFYLMDDRFVPKARKIAEDKARKIRKLSEASIVSENDDEDEHDLDGFIDLTEYEPDSRTGEPRPKRKKSSYKPSRSGKKAGAKEEKKKSTRKVYKVHKYKKSATSKAARSAQGKGKRKRK